MTSSSEQFAAAWSLWSSKGHSPIEKLKVFETHVGVMIGILDYITLDKYILPDSEVFDSYEKALASIGRALDTSLKKTTENNVLH
ncbi:MAG: hypothetical protein M0Q29_09965 [Thiopseudomonas sp.]|nr:hypothetical protein [Thiopseudomonas sp.]